MISDNKGAVNALLAENEKAIHALQDVIRHISNEQLIAIADSETHNTECVSIQSVLTHVVSSGFSYCVYIRNHRGGKDVRPAGQSFNDVSRYVAALDDVHRYTQQTLGSMYDYELEEFDQSQKIATRWGQSYDIEQLMEHAIVHILRHRRQIEGFIAKLNKE